MRYINPGFAEYVDIDGGTTIADTTCNPTSRVADCYTVNTTIGAMTGMELGWKAGE